MAGGWKAVLVRAKVRWHALFVVPALAEPPKGGITILCRPSNSSYRSGNRNALADKLFLSLSYSLLEVFAWPDDDRCITGLNLDVVHPSEARPDPTINCFCSFCFHWLSTTCHSADCRKPNPDRTPAMIAKIVARSRGC